MSDALDEAEAAFDNTAHGWDTRVADAIELLLKWGKVEVEQRLAALEAHGSPGNRPCLRRATEAEAERDRLRADVEPDWTPGLYTGSWRIGGEPAKVEPAKAATAADEMTERRVMSEHVELAAARAVLLEAATANEHLARTNAGLMGAAKLLNYCNVVEQRLAALEAARSWLETNAADPKFRAAYDTEEAAEAAEAERDRLRARLEAWEAEPTEEELMHILGDPRFDDMPVALSLEFLRAFLAGRREAK